CARGDTDDAFDFW
nr:immunoglobulin heavy chain junction region [Macaca mulatta]